MPIEFREFLKRISLRQDLTREQAEAAFAHLTSGEATEAQIAGLLVGLAVKGAAVEELVGAASVMRKKCQPMEYPGDAGDLLDTCGTGGDSRHTFNISTTAALIAAACGVKVVKHGNRAASGKSGAADVLEKLGVKLELTPYQLGQCLASANICFAYARTSHPAMKFVAETRAALGIPTIFNLLGPLTNPGGASRQLAGVYSAELTEKLAVALRQLGSKRAWVVHADDGLDEISTMSLTRVSELKDGKIHTWTLDAAELGLSPARLEDLQVADVTQAADAVLSILNGDKGPKRDIALLNAAAALVIAEKASDLPAALRLAEQALDSGSARQALKALIESSWK
jgi:anthranilate phosphoribosyltransferase